MTNWPGHKALFVFGECRLQLERAGLRVDLVVDHRQRALGELGPAVAGKGIDRQSPAFRELLGHLHPIFLGKREHHRDRLELGDHDDRLAVDRHDHVAGIDLAQPGAAVDRRGDARIFEVEPRPLRLGLRGLDGRLELADIRALAVERLPRADTSLLQFLQPPEVGLGGDDLRLADTDLRLGLPYRGLIGGADR